MFLKVFNSGAFSEDNTFLVGVFLMSLYAQKADSSTVDGLDGARPSGR
jgi:hypothetical protein